MCTESLAANIEFCPHSVFTGSISVFSKLFCSRAPFWLRKITMDPNIPFFFNGSTAPWGPRPPHFSRLHDHTFFRHSTLGRTPLHEWSARRRDLYLTTHNTYKRQTSMPPAGFEPTCEWPQTHALDRAATGIGPHILAHVNILSGW
jgi:hypothetical protein